MSAEVLKQFSVMGIGLKKQQCGPADVGRDVVNAVVPAPCNPWGGDVGDDLSFAMPNSCLSCRDDDPKKLSSAQQSDDVSSIGRQPWSNITGLV